MAAMEPSTIWLIVREDNAVSDLKEIQISDQKASSCYAVDRRHLLESLCAQAGISYSADKVYKLRNGRGSLVPLCRQTTPNTVTSPYILEVCETHKTVKPGQRHAIIPGYNKTCQKKYESLSKRVERLEQMIPDLPELRIAKLTNEMRDVESRLSFLNERMKEAESQEWKGMFKKHPLW